MANSIEALCRGDRAHPTGRSSSGRPFSWFARSLPPMAGLAVALTGVGSPVFAQDHNQQVKVLSAVYLWQQYSNMCAIERPAFGDETRGQLGSMSVYAQHIRAEVVSRLPPEKIQSVLVQAATAARAGARAKLTEFVVGPAKVDRVRLRNWCETTAKPYTLKIMAMHDHQHDLFRCDAPGKSDRGYWLRDCASFFGPDEKGLYRR